jgi:ferritin-like metal-binding protein YciE
VVRILQTRIDGGRFMATVTLRDLYAAELHDLMNAERQILEELLFMAGRATSADLRRALDRHHGETKVHADRLRLLLEQMNDQPPAQPSGAVAALIEDGRRRLGDAERGEILDAALIAAVQRIEHYEIATYGTARSFAQSLGDHDAVRILQQTLDEEGHTDHVLTKLAERGINRAAGEDLVEDSTRYRSRLRYIAAKELPGATEEGELHIHNDEGEHLGTLDGFVVDSRSGRPIYYVVDSRGWFVGRRYVVPVGQIEPGEPATELHTTLTRNELSRYPEFSPSAFLAMEDSDALRYERRLHRSFDPDAKPYDGRPVYENLPVYRTPTWLQTGVWMSDSSGFVLSAPRDGENVTPVRPVPDPPAETGVYERTTAPESAPFDRRTAVPGAENDRMTARGPSSSLGAAEPQDEGMDAPPDHVPDSIDVEPRSTEQPKTSEPRIERYRDR